MGEETTYAIIKPDGVMLGILPEMIRKINECGFRVARICKLQISSELVRKIYVNDTDKDYFEGLVSWMSSQKVIIIFLSGDNAISTLKKRIIGKYPDGLRGKYSKSKMMNITHSPDSYESSVRELALILDYIENNGPSS